MPARLDEAFGTSLDNLTRKSDTPQNQFASPINQIGGGDVGRQSHGESFNLRGGDVGRQSRGANFNLSGGQGFNQVGGGGSDLASSLSSLESLKNPAFNAHEAHRLNNGGNDVYRQSGGGGQVSNVPLRPSLVQPYTSDILNSNRADLACQAYTCAAREFEGHSGPPKSYNWYQAVLSGVPKAQLTGPGREQPKLIAETCDSHLQHIWSCSKCRQQLKDMLSADNENDTDDANVVLATPSPCSPVGLTGPRQKSVNLKDVFNSFDMPNLVYNLLLGLALLILFDMFVKLGRNL